jgi:hypothetical protein
MTRRSGLVRQSAERRPCWPITAVVFFGYVSLAWKVILEDYVPHAGTPARRCWSCC